MDTISVFDYNRRMAVWSDADCCFDSWRCRKRDGIRKHAVCRLTVPALCAGHNV